MLGCYPSLNLHDPETYIAEVVSLLSGYPLWAGERAVAEVKTTCKFVPTLAEIKPALESNVKTVRYAEEWRQDAQRQVESRPLLEGPKAPRPTLEELKAKHGPNWGLGQTEQAENSKKLHLEALERANMRALERQIRERGGDVSGEITISPSLREKLRQQAAE